MIHRLAGNCLNSLFRTLRPARYTVSFNSTHQAIRSLSSESTTKSFGDHVRQLKAEMSRRKYPPSVVSVKEAISLLENSQSVNRGDLQILLNLFGETMNELPVEERSNLLNKTWTIIRTKFRKELDISHYNAYVRCLIDNEVRFVPAEFMRELEEMDIYPNRSTYENLIEKFCRAGDVEGASKIVTFMRENIVFVGKPVFDSFLFAYSKIMDLENVENTLSYMKSNKISPDSYSYLQITLGLIEACAKDEKAHENLKKYFDHFISSRPSSRDLWKAICSLMKSDPSSKLLNSAFSNVHGSYLYDAIGVMYELINCKKHFEAFRVLTFIKSRSLDNDAILASRFFLIRMIGTEYDAETIFYYCRKISANRISPFAFSDASEAAQLAYGPEKSRIFLEKFIQVNGRARKLTHHFTDRSILKATPAPAPTPPKKQVANYEGMSLESYTKNLHSLHSKLDEVLLMRKSLIARGIKPPISIESQLVQRLLQGNKFDEAFDICEEYLNDKSYLLPNVLKRVISHISSAGKLDLLKRIEPKLPQQLKDDTWYKERLIETILNSNKIAELAKVMPQIESIRPRALMKILDTRPNLSEEIFNFVKNISSIEFHNALWLCYMLRGQWDKAQVLFDLNPPFARFIRFHELIIEVRTNHNLQLADRVIEMFYNTEKSPRSIALFYSAKIDVLIDQNRLAEAEELVLSLEKLPPRMDSVGKLFLPVTINHINRITLVRLYNKIFDVEGRNAKFQLPLKESADREFADESEAIH